MKNNVRGIENAHDHGCSKSAHEAEPKGSQNDRKIIKALEDIMQNRFRERCKVMEKTDSDNSPKNYGESDRDLEFIHNRMLSRDMLGFKFPDI